MDGILHRLIWLCDQTAEKLLSNDLASHAVDQAVDSYSSFVATNVSKVIVKRLAQAAAAQVSDFVAFTVLALWWIYSTKSPAYNSYLFMTLSYICS